MSGERLVDDGGVVRQQHPIVLDLAVGTAGQRADFRVETFACVEPWEFADAVQKFVHGLLYGPEKAVEDEPAPPVPLPRKPSAAERARARAAEAV